MLNDHPNTPKTFDDYVRLAPHFIAVGQVKMRMPWGHRPWEAVTACEDTGTTRAGQVCAIEFKVEHECGITFTWEVDPSCWGDWDETALTDGLKRLPKRFRRKLVAATEDNIEKTRKRIKECSEGLARMEAALKAIDD